MTLSQSLRGAVVYLHNATPSQKAILGLGLAAGCYLVKLMLESWQGTILLGALCCAAIHIWTRRVQVIASSSARTPFPASFSSPLTAISLYNRSISPIVRGYFKDIQLDSIFSNSRSTYHYPSTGYFAFTWHPLPFCIHDAITSDMSRRIIKSWNPDCPIKKWDLTYIQLTHWNGIETSIGEILVHKDIVRRVADIFSELFKSKFPIYQMRLIDHYDANINHSMENNNTFAFCSIISRGVSRSYSYGIAITINPFLNPCVDKVNRTIPPKGSEAYLNRNLSIAGMIKEGDACHTAFIKHGFIWGGNWENPDYKHFEFNQVIKY